MKRTVYLVTIKLDVPTPGTSTESGVMNHPNRWHWNRFVNDGKIPNLETDDYSAEFISSQEMREYEI